MKTVIKSLARKAGYEIARARKAGDQYLSPGERFPHDFSEVEIELILRAKPFTMTSPERVVSLIHAIEYIISWEISGDIVECGVWRGGSMMVAAWTLLRLNRGDIPLRLFDTFAGMSEPSAVDGEAANETWRNGWAKNHNNSCFAPLEEVRANKHGLRTGPDLICGRRRPGNHTPIRTRKDCASEARYRLVRIDQARTVAPLSENRTRRGVADR